MAVENTKEIFNEEQDNLIKKEGENKKLKIIKAKDFIDVLCEMIGDNRELVESKL